MSKDLIFRQYQTGDERNPLRVPFLLDIKTMPEEEISAIIDKICEKIDAGFLFGKDNVMSVIQDYKETASKPLTYGKSAYLVVRVRREDQMIVSSTDQISKHAGCTVYALDQLESMLESVSAENFTQRIVPDVEHKGAFGFDI